MIGRRNYLKFNLSHHQMEMGSERDIFNLDVQKCKNCYSETYIYRLWKNLATYLAKLQLHCKPEIVIAREGDKFIMDIATSIGMSKKQLLNINEIRKHLQILLLWDIVTLNGKRLTQDIEGGISRKSNLSWPENFPKRNWKKLRKESLAQLHPHFLKYLPLGDFIKTPHQIWTTMTTLEGDKILIEDKLFEKDISGKLTEIGQDSSL